MTLKPTRLAPNPYEWDYLPCMKGGYPNKIRILLEVMKQETDTKKTIKDACSTVENEILKHQLKYNLAFATLFPHVQIQNQFSGNVSPNPSGSFQKAIPLGLQVSAVSHQ